MSETKVVYNGCYGGFSLSREAVLLARELSGNPTWGGATIKGDICERTIVTSDYGFVDVPRHDPILVEVVEKLGSEKASGACASLHINTVYGNQYRIDEYDGIESVMSGPDDYDWVIIK